MSFMMARIQLKYGKVEQFNEIMSHLVPILEKNGFTLLGAYQTRIGTLNECWDVWEVPDANGIQSVLQQAHDDSEFAEWAGRLPECVEQEEIRYLEKLPYSP
jgi:hypothetical protein